MQLKKLGKSDEDEEEEEPEIKRRKDFTGTDFRREAGANFLL